MNKPSVNIRKWVALAVVILLAAIIAPRFFGKGAETDEPRKNEQPANMVSLTPNAKDLADLKTAVVRYGDSASTLLLSGTCQVDQNAVAKVTAPVSGRVTRLAVSPGQYVNSGSVVAVLDSVDLAEAKKALTESISARAQSQAQITVAQARVSAAQRKLERQNEFQQSGAFAAKPVEDAQSELAVAEGERRVAQSELVRAKSELARSQELYQSQIVAKKDLEVAQSEEKSAQAKLDAAEEKVRIAKQALSREQVVSKKNLLNRREVEDAASELQSARADLTSARVARSNADRTIQAARENVRVLGGAVNGGTGTLVVRAPIGGVVVDREVTLGQSIERGSEICEVANLSTIWVIGNAYEKDMPQLSMGQAVTVKVNAFPNTEFVGRITNIGAVLDEKSRTVTVRCQVANTRGQLKPGMFAQLSVMANAKPSVILVPEAAIQEEANKKYVFVVEGASYRKADVRLGEASNGYHEVLSGLKSGDRVVTEGSFILKSETKKSEMEGD
ncbi:MAG: efflux RND transporter periplasmic adaptor subunit [Armatimonadetes bacterium]|nr:efflux RND transporter periplasmic adaptor subunit [Armatimonadota bacterium]